VFLPNGLAIEGAPFGENCFVDGDSQMSSRDGTSGDSLLYYVYIFVYWIEIELFS
jgi:hypothetical protein